MKQIKQFFINLFGWISNIWYVYISPVSIVRVFKGWGHWYLSVKYADRRAMLSRANKFCGGKRYYVLPIDSYSLMVIDRLEIQTLKDKKFIKKSYNINDILKTAYYVTNEKS